MTSRSDLQGTHPMRNQAELESLVESCVTQAESLLSSLSALDWLGYGTELKYSDIPSLPRLRDFLSAALAITRTIENAGCAIHRLPTEILAKVFGYLPQDALAGHTFHRTDFPNTDHHSVQDYAALQQVCRHWRQILTPLPSYWTTIVLQKGSWTTSDKFIEFYLAKSVPQPIDVIAETFSGLAIVAQHSSRLRSLQIQHNEKWTSMIDDAFGSLCHGAPILESFNCHIQAPNADEELDISESKLPLVFAGDTPSLRKLRLHGFTSWHGNQFDHLTHICIHGWSSSNTISNGFQELLSLISHNPAVEEIYFSVLDPWIPEDWDDTLLETTHLTHLRRLSLSNSTVSQYIALISHLHIPAHASISLNNTIARPEDGNIVSLLRDPFKFDNLTNVKSLVTRFACNVIAFGPSGSLQINTAYDYGDRFLRYSNLDEWFFAENLREVWLNSPTEDSPQTDWFAFFAALPSLRKLSLQAVVTKPLIRALSRQSSPPRFSTARTLCRSLQTLWIIEDYDMMPNWLNSSYYDLLQCAEMRYANGVPFQELKIQSAIRPADGWPGSMVDALRQYAMLVDMDAQDLAVDIPEELNENLHSDYWPKWC
ncbi:hypothetical protein EIP91_004398 [Steccherinum ochraceum]|uniref:F-box domain-containing protein n=1 Tax=Steccherinum ochraceum TaxID=92696 RepID=A0A4V2MXI5_9APHY|nr:hypothetical protein EIP91_004398 [Steccherinum ochraceum]